MYYLHEIPPSASLLPSFFILSLIIILYPSSTSSFFFFSCFPLSSSPSLTVFLSRTCTQYHLLLTCFSSPVTFHASDSLGRANSHTRVCTHMLTHTSWIIKAVYCSIDGARDCLFGQAGTADSEPPSHGPTFTAFITTCNISPIPPFIPLYLAASPDHLCIPPSLSIHHCIANPPVLFNFLSITLSPLWCLHLEVRQ